VESLSFTITVDDEREMIVGGTVNNNMLYVNVHEGIVAYN